MLMRWILSAKKINLKNKNISNILKNKAEFIDAEKRRQYIKEGAVIFD